MSIRSAIIRKSLYPYLLKRENRGSAYKYWDIYKESQYWSKDKLLEFQLAQLKKLLKYSFENTVYYKEVFDKAGTVESALPGAATAILNPQHADSSSRKLKAKRAAFEILDGVTISFQRH